MATGIDYRVPSIGGRMPSPVTSYHKTGDEVEVYCRIRHVNGIIESSSDTENEDPTIDSTKIAACKTIDPKTIALTTIDKRNNKIENVTHYSFTQAFSSQIGQKAVFNNVAKPNVDRLIDGGNALLFAYGVTGSGKTYTMMGSKEEPGILPRTLNLIFNSVADRQTNSFEVKPGNFNKFNMQSPADAMMERQQRQINYFQNGGQANNKSSKIDEQLIDYQFGSTSKSVSSKINPHVKYAVFVTFIEIYNDRVYDLLDDSQRYGISTHHSKKLREDDQKQSYIDGVNEIEVKSMKEAFQQYYIGKERRRLAQTELNFTSSRSHSIFQIRLVRAPFDSSTDEIYQDKRLLQISRLALVDLAGSERVSRTGAQGAVLSEASNINTSLMALRRCIEALRKNQKGLGHKAEYVPFRTKKIVNLFRPFFEGEGKITILICINPSKSDANETEHVLAFAESARKIEVETKEIGNLDGDAILRKKQELEARDIERMEKAQKYKKDLQKNIRYKVPPPQTAREKREKDRDRERRATLKREPTNDSDYRVVLQRFRCNTYF